MTLARNSFKLLATFLLLFWLAIRASAQSTSGRFPGTVTDGVRSRPEIRSNLRSIDGGETFLRRTVKLDDVAKPMGVWHPWRQTCHASEDRPGGAYFV